MTPLTPPRSQRNEGDARGVASDRPATVAHTRVAPRPTRKVRIWRRISAPTPGRNPTVVTGRDVGGNLPDQTNSLVTTENTPVTAHSNAICANVHSPEVTISVCTWRGTYRQRVSRSRTENETQRHFLTQAMCEIVFETGIQDPLFVPHHVHPKSFYPVFIYIQTCILSLTERYDEHHKVLKLITTKDKTPSCKMHWRICLSSSSRTNVDDETKKTPSAAKKTQLLGAEIGDTIRLSHAFNEWHAIWPHWPHGLSGSDISIWHRKETKILIWWKLPEEN